MKISVLPFYRRRQRIWARLFTVLIRASFNRCDRGTILYPPLRVGGEKHIAIGSNVYLGPNSWLQVIGADSSKGEPRIQLGDNVSITGYCTITATHSVIIEKSVLMARYVYISDHSHVHASREMPILNQGITSPKEVLIKEGAWLGQGVVVCPGVTIGKNAVIGANSIVRRDIPDFCVAAGSPARVIREIDAKRP